VAKPKQQPEQQQAEQSAPFDIAGLLADSLEIVRREINNLMAASAGEKLTHNSSMDLIAYVKMLNALHGQEKELLDSMPQEELDKMLKDPK
jgi:hypothetical protein